MKIQITYVKVPPPSFRPSPILHSIVEVPDEVDLSVQDRGGPFLDVRKYLAKRDGISENSFDVFDATKIE